MKFEVVKGDKTSELEFDTGTGRVTVDGKNYEYSFAIQENGRRFLRIGTKIYKIDNIGYDRHEVTFTLNGNWCTAQVRNEQDLLLDKLGFKTTAEAGEGELKAPMPGKILEILVEEQSEVELGDPVVILEAMKMENELKAPISGTVTSIAVQKGDSVEKNALIVEIEASG